MGDSVTLCQGDLTTALSYFWHPVCTTEELAAAPNDVLGVRLLGRELVVGDLGSGRLACLVDRCLHRSTRLSIGSVDAGAIRCSYHGWRWAADGQCIDIPTAPHIAISPRACVESFAVQERYGLIWVCLNTEAGTTVPSCPAFEDPDMVLVAGVPYTWPVAVGRRVENFTDLSHFAWVHDGTLGRRDQPVPPIPSVRRADGALRFDYVSPELETQESVALMGYSDYHVIMPGTVNIAFDIAGQAGVRRHLWMTASPLDSGSCRTFWLVARNDAHQSDEHEIMAFQGRVLEEDAPVVCNQLSEFPLDVGAELSVKADRVSIEYRRWMQELVMAAQNGPAMVRSALYGTSGQTLPRELDDVVR
ncbi:MAG TPA: aromatic ring-hydroxylating dioxygenase subunit alpha [Acidimicrobiales bacterium]|jgi:vanillate O-demethylase monooxygenase subunit|nr:aromatic ring-hydroxylating dioxygenase subunit alpha [Acidimicrobiales bacterium]